MTNLLDFIAFAVLWWTAAAALAGGHEVRDWRSAVLTTALIAMLVSSFAGAVAATKGIPGVNWWGRGVVYASATVAAWFYEYRFGIARHIRMAWRGTVDWFRSVTHHGEPHA